VDVAGNIIAGALASSKEGGRMSQLRRVVGVVVGVLLVLSAAAHSLLGGEAIREALVAAEVPADLLRGALIGWHFGGAAMLAFGAVVLHTFARRRDADGVSLLPARIVAATYLAFGCGALVLTDFDPFFLVFVVPGSLLALVAFPRRDAAGGT
jgi:hypothetical protein